MVPNGFASSRHSKDSMTRGNFGVDGWRPVSFQAFALLLMEHELSHLIVSALEAPDGADRHPSYYTPYYCPEDDALIERQIRSLKFPALAPLLDKLQEVEAPFQFCHSPYWHCLTFAAFGHVGKVTTDDIKGVLGLQRPKSFKRGPVVWEARNDAEQLNDIVRTALFE